MKKNLVFGTFDGLHSGHVNFLGQAKSHGDYLIAVVSRDSTGKKIKRRRPLNNERKRLEEVRKCGLINEAVLGHKDDRYKIVKEINPDVICLGYDQKPSVKYLARKLKAMNLKVEIHRMKPYRPKKFHSSLIKTGKKSNGRKANFDQ
jgi:FAD synthetase